MKKILIAIILFNLMCACLVTNVNAAYAYSWTVNGELLTTLNNSNKEGTAVWTSDEKYTGGVLTLNNYSGGQLKIDCYGTGYNNVFAVKLVGDNKIDVENGIGIIANFPIVFIGNGTLTISAPIPIGTDNAYDRNTNSLFDFNEIDYYKKTTVVIDPSATGSIDNIGLNIKGYHFSQNNSEKSDSSKEENNSDLSNAEETDSNKNNENINETDETSSFESDKQKERQGVLDSNLFKVIVLLYCVISLITIVILIIKLASKRKL